MEQQEAAILNALLKQLYIVCLCLSPAMRDRIYRVKSAATMRQDLRMCCAMRGSAKEPSITVPQGPRFLHMVNWLQQPSEWLGEGFAVRMDTPSADWRFVLKTSRGSRDVCFVRNMYKMGVKGDSAADVQESFLALQAEYYRYGAHANIPFKMIIARLPYHAAGFVSLRTL